MTDVLTKQLALALDKRLAVYKKCMQDGSILNNNTEKQMAVFMITEILRPCCCMICNTNKLEQIFHNTSVFAGNSSVIEELAKTVYLELARMNGLG